MSILKQSFLISPRTVTNVSAAPSIGDAFCHDTYVYGNSIGPNWTKFGTYIPYMVEI